MRSNMSFAFIFSLLVVFLSPAASAQTAGQNNLDGCADELKQYCSTVTPGEGRVLGCLKSHGDKLTDKCVAAIVRSEFQINSSALIMTYVATQCLADAKSYCPDVQVGDGKILTCLTDNLSSLKDRCSLALKDIGAVR
ncbi:MAG: cysteine rich repeat-containing protein [Fimbriimonadaceae bacterium]|nr:cysteine rich repeat-containing protein [Alphaproteobacteria bacterium]